MLNNQPWLILSEGDNVAVATAGESGALGVGLVTGVGAVHPVTARPVATASINTATSDRRRDPGLIPGF